MALIAMDSFDERADANMLGKWTNKVAGTNDNSAIVAGVGRRGTQGLRLSTFATADSTARYVWTPGSNGPTPSGPTCIAGFSFLPAASFNFGTSTTEGLLSATMFSVRYSGTTQVWFRLLDSGQIAAYRGTTLLGTSTWIFALSVTDYWEFLVTVSTSAGVVQLRRNGDMDATLNLSGINTRGSSADLWDSIAVGHIRVEASLANFVYDDFYLLDGTTTADDPRNSFLDDSRCDANYPDDDGFYADAVPSGGAVPHYTMVDEALMDGDTTYNLFANAGDKDSYTYPALPVPTADCHGLQINAWQRKEDAGSVTTRVFTRQGGTDYNGDSRNPSTTYTDQRQVWAQNPNGSADFTDIPEMGMEKEV